MLLTASFTNLSNFLGKDCSNKVTWPSGINHLQSAVSLAGQERNPVGRKLPAGDVGTARVVRRSGPPRRLQQEDGKFG